MTKDTKDGFIKITSKDCEAVMKRHNLDSIFVLALPKELIVSEDEQGVALAIPRVHLQHLIDGATEFSETKDCAIGVLSNPGEKKRQRLQEAIEALLNEDECPCQRCKADRAA